MHVFKNAGTSLLEALQRSFGDDFQTIEPPGDRGFLSVDQVDAAIAAKPTLSAISSHRANVNFARLSDGREMIPLLLVRHPFARIQSMYRFYRQLGDHQVAEEGFALSSNFEDWFYGRIAAGRHRDMLNAQTRHIVNASLNDEAEMTQADLRAAMDLAKSLHYMGTVDRLEETLASWEFSLRHYFPRLDLSVSWSNATSRSPDKDASLGSAALVQKINALNATDLTLHQIANHQVDEFIKLVPDWENYFADFRSRCARRAAAASANEPDRDSPRFGVPLGYAPSAGTPHAVITGISLTNDRAIPTTLFSRGDTLRLSITAQWNVAPQAPLIGFTLFAVNGETVLCMNTDRTAVRFPPIASGGSATITFAFQLATLNNGLYRLDLAIVEGTEAQHDLYTQAPAALWFAMGPRCGSIMPGLLNIDRACEISVELA